jgi:hypothetical protein
MTGDELIALTWMAGVILVGILLVAAFRARRRGGAYRGAVIGATYEWQSQDKRRALELIVEDKAEARRGEHRDGNLPELEDPDGGPNGAPDGRPN